MKTKLTFLLALTVLGTINLLAQTTPAKEFNITITEPAISLAPGESKTVDVFVNRSTKFRKTKIKLYVDNKLPAGLTIDFERASEAGQADKMIVSAGENAANYSGTFVLKASSARLTKGAMFNLAVDGETIYTDKR